MIDTSWLQWGFLLMYLVFLGSGCVGLGRTAYYQARISSLLTRFLLYVAKYTLAWRAVTAILALEMKTVPASSHQLLPAYIIGNTGFSAIMSSLETKRANWLLLWAKKAIGDTAIVVGALRLQGLYLERIGMCLILGNLAIGVVLVFALSLISLSGTSRLRKEEVASPLIKERVQQAASCLGISNYLMFAANLQETALPSDLAVVVGDIMTFVAISNRASVEFLQELVANVAMHHLVEWKHGYLYQVLLLDIILSATVYLGYSAILLSGVMGQYSMTHRFIVAGECYWLAKHLQSLVLGYLTVLCEKRILRRVIGFSPDISQAYEKYPLLSQYSVGRTLSLPDLDLFYLYTPNERSSDIKGRQI